MKLRCADVYDADTNAPVVSVPIQFSRTGEADLDCLEESTDDPLLLVDGRVFVMINATLLEIVLNKFTAVWTFPNLGRGWCRAAVLGEKHILLTNEKQIFLLDVTEKA